MYINFVILQLQLLLRRIYLSFIICPIAMAYSYGTDNKIGLRLSVCLCVCVSVRVSSLSRSHFFVDFHQI